MGGTHSSLNLDLRSKGRAWALASGRYMDAIGHTGRVRVNDDRSVSAVKRSIRQINIRQHYDQQHQENDAAKNQQSRSF